MQYVRNISNSWATITLSRGTPTRGISHLTFHVEKVNLTWKSIFVEDALSNQAAEEY
jgi:hypothetical protein